MAVLEFAANCAPSSVAEAVFSAWKMRCEENGLSLVCDVVPFCACLLDVQCADPLPPPVLWVPIDNWTHRYIIFGPPSLCSTTDGLAMKAICVKFHSTSKLHSQVIEQIRVNVKVPEEKNHYCTWYRDLECGIYVVDGVDKNTGERFRHAEELRRVLEEFDVGREQLPYRDKLMPDWVIWALGGGFVHK